MKIARFFAAVFAVLGCVLMLGTAVVCFASLDSTPWIVELPSRAVDCSEELREAVNSGDYAAAGALMYGQPDLGAEGIPEDALGIVIWDAFRDSISLEFTGDCYAEGADLFRDGTVTALEIPGVTEALKIRFHALLTQRVEEATDMAELYDEENNFREDLVTEVLYEALKQTLEEAQPVTREMTVKLILRDEQWWVVPDEALLAAISGGLA